MTPADIKDVLEAYYSVVKRATKNIAEGNKVEGNKAVIIAYGRSILELEEDLKIAEKTQSATLKTNQMKKRIEKFIKEYKLNISRTEEEIKELKKELTTEQLNLNKESSIGKFNNLLTDVELIKRDIAVQKKKKQILVQAKSNFECLLPHA